MEEQYTPDLIEADAQSYWETQESFKVNEDLSTEKFYCLSMFPYPSGQLHMGHVRNYSLGDVIARYQTMQGKNVLQPMGWDAFGLPAENAALKHQVAPAQWTYKNTAHMRSQFKRMGFAYDWSREITTCKPEYYRWEQWLFLQLYEKGLVYKKNAMVNWDPVDQTVLANEQVVNGRGWRSDALIERREIPQWFFKITDYADELLNDLDKLAGWPEKVKTMQRHWIGRSEGVDVVFQVADQDTQLTVFTTRPDTLLGVTYLAIAAEHPLATLAAQEDSDLADFIDACKRTPVNEESMATLEKRGMATPFYAVHPLNGERVPIWVANFVLMEYGTGAVMSVPAHDQRDFEFAQTYNLPIKQVVVPSDEQQGCDLNQQAFTDKGKLINSGEFNNLDFDKAFKAITDKLQSLEAGERKIHFRLRDWGVSRQRYWGTPIPIIYCDSCGTVPVPADQLPVVLPEDVAFDASGNLLKSIDEFYHVPCPQCGNPAHRETDTFDTFVESSWYYARYACVNQESKMLDDRAKYWTPVDQYIGGIEHAVMHLLYARFFHKVMRDLGFVNSDEPFLGLLSQGMVLKDGHKMSKSKGNVVDPTALIQEYGADTVRLFTIFASPPEQSLEWSDSGVEGSFRFLKRLWSLAYKLQTPMREYNNRLQANADLSVDWDKAPKELAKLRREIYSILRQANYDFKRLQLNTVVSGSMKLLNILSKVTENEIAEAQEVQQHLLHTGLSILLRLLAPITPHITHHLWRELGYGEDILAAKWPKLATDALACDEFTLIVQVNGKKRSEITIASDADQAQIQAAALADSKIANFIGAQSLKKCIVVPGKLVNLVIG